MNYRIYTHGSCSSLDGFASAYIFKRYLAPILSVPTTVIVSGLDPSEIETEKYKAHAKDIVLDLPKPKEEIFFWCDHHITSKPVTSLPKNHYWALKPSCAGYLIEIAAGMGLELSPELAEFKEAIDIMDSAGYTLEQLHSVYYPQDNYDNLTMLQRVHMVSSLIHTKTPQLNKSRFRTMLTGNLGETPVTVEEMLKLDPLAAFKGQLTHYREWREWVDAFQRYDRSSGCVIQDQRKAGPMPGSPDRYYSYLKFPESVYSIRISLHGGKARMSIGTNIFQKEKRKLGLGQFGVEIAGKFGEGVAGGHEQVCGLTIFADKVDEALEEILNKFRDAK